MPGEKTDQSEACFEYSRDDMRKDEHSIELRGMTHIVFQGRQKDLRGVAEDDDAQRRGKRREIDAQLNFRPVPDRGFRETIDDDDHVDNEMNNSVSRTETGNKTKTTNK